MHVTPNTPHRPSLSLPLHRLGYTPESADCCPGPVVSSKAKLLSTNGRVEHTNTKKIKTNKNASGVKKELSLYIIISPPSPRDWPWSVRASGWALIHGDITFFSSRKRKSKCPAE
ncbi:unnamed protein product [Ectocarpus fasciculatus]